MTVAQMRELMDAWWVETNVQAIAHKNSQAALLALFEFYGALGEEDRAVADEVLKGWLSDSDAAKQYDAIGAIRRFRIISAVPQLQALAASLRQREDPTSRYTLLKVRELLQTLQR